MWVQKIILIQNIGLSGEKCQDYFGRKEKQIVIWNVKKVLILTVR